MVIGGMAQTKRRANLAISQRLLSKSSKQVSVKRERDGIGCTGTSALMMRYLDPPAAPPIELNAGNMSTSSSSHSWQRTPSSNTLAVPEDQASTRGLSAPSTPVMKKSSLDVEKQDVSRRRRATSNASMTSNSMMQASGLQISHPQQQQQHATDTPVVTTWASTMDDIELQSIPSEERSRQEAIFELITTERSYLRDLQMIVNVSWLIRVVFKQLTFGLSVLGIDLLYGL